MSRLIKRAAFAAPETMPPELRGRAIKAMVDMRKACNAKGIECPINHLVPDDALFDHMPPELLQNTLVMCTWPGIDVRIGGPEGRVQEGTGTKGKVLIFHDRKAVVTGAIEFMEKAAGNINGTTTQ